MDPGHSRHPRHRHRRQTIISTQTRPLKATLVALAGAGEALSRRIPGSHGHRAVKAKLAHLDRRVHLRREASATHHRVGGHYGQVAIEDLDVAAMAGMRRRAADRADTWVSQLAHKTAKCSGVLTRWRTAAPPAKSGCTSPDGTCRLQGKRPHRRNTCSAL